MKSDRRPLDTIGLPRGGDASAAEATGEEILRLRGEVQELRLRLRENAASGAAAPGSTAPGNAAPEGVSDGAAGMSFSNAVGDSTRFHAELLDALPVQVAVLDAQHRYLYLNQAAVRDPETRRWLVGKTDVDYCHLRDLDPSFVRRRTVWRRKAEEQRETLGFEEEMVDREGQKRVFLRLHTPVFDADGDLLHLLAYGMDVTEHRQLEAQLRQSQKLEALGQLVGGIAHDFNNLLTALHGYSDLLIAAIDRDNAAHDLAEEVKLVAEKASGLTRQLLAYGRKKEWAAEVLDLNELLRETSRLLERTLGETIELRADLAEEPQKIRGDAGQIHQVVLNLALNARDAMGGTGIIEMRTATVKSLLHEGESLPGPWRLLEVRDHGCGMEPEVRARIFEPFFTTKEEEEGTGLGLSSVAGILREGRAHISVDSQTDVGSVFKVHFPAAESPVEEVESAVRPSLGGGGETLLLAEDEDSVRRLSSTYLRGLGYRVLEAADGKAALEISRAEGRAIDLVVSDVVMPRMGGAELVRTLAVEQPGIRWIFVSGYPGMEPLPPGPDGEVAFLAKPFRPVDLGSFVRKILSG